VKALACELPADADIPLARARRANLRRGADAWSPSGPVGWVCRGSCPREWCLVRTSSTCPRPSAATVSWHTSAHAVSSTPTPDALLPVHAAQMWIDSASILRNMTSGIGDQRVCGTLDRAADSVRCCLLAEGR
jgi:hypothetical protein